MTRCAEPGWLWAIGPGLLLGGAALFKHDIAAYAAIATGGALLLTRYRARVASVWTPIVVMGAVATATVAAVTSVLIALGAAPDLWRDLVQFPLTDFSYVRPERFPIVPRLDGHPVEVARELILWATCNFPLFALVSGMIGLWRRRHVLDASTTFIVVYAFLAFWLHWVAAHVQINTHAITLTAWGALIGGAGLRGVSMRRPVKLTLAAAVAIWWAVLLAKAGYTVATQAREPRGWVGLPHLAGIRASSADAAWMRQLAVALAEDVDPGAPLLFLSSRNDVHVFAKPTPYWLTTRRPATRHHELHPGITDTESTQRQMLASFGGNPLPLVVLEHRFSNEVLDRVKADHMRHVPIGSKLIDEWLAQHYEPASSFGPYQLMRRRSSAGQ